ncbi:hypothetical protein Sjap_003552 [Stephania japonica]|uniref:Uncharacterized protein n=1 Tax=Stephania japonica TaxID=461633 RepID=A0AAP0KNZ5_9MAGN
MVRNTSCEKTGLKRGAWTHEEDRKLSTYIKKYGHWNWRELPKYAGLSRCGKSCRLRWVNYLKPDIKRGGYTKEEEEIINNLHETLGNRWSAIAAKLPGRTDNEIKNYWHTHLKKRVKRNSNGSTSKADEKKSQLTQREKHKKSKITEPITSLNSSTGVAATLTVLESSSVSNPTLSPNKFQTNFSSTPKPEYCNGIQTGSSQLCSLSSSSSSSSTSVSEDIINYNASFWTEPFLVDDDFTSNHIGIHDLDARIGFTLDDEGSIIEQVPMCAYEFYSENSMDFWFNQLNLAEELPRLWSS